MKTFVKSLLVVSVVLFASCDFKKKAQQEEATVEVLPKIEVETAKRESVVQQISFTGSVEAYAVNNIAPQQARRIERILYDVGDRVRHIKFGDGEVMAIVAGGRDYEVTVDFDKAGTRKMFASFAKLKKI